MEQACQAEKQSSQRIDQDLGGAHTNATQTGRVLVGANGKNMATEDGVFHDQRHDHGQPHGHPYPGRQGPKAQRIHRFHDLVERIRRRVDGLVIGQPLGNPAGDAHHSQSHDERNHFEPGHDTPIDRSDGPSCKDRQQDYQSGRDLLNEKRRSHDAGQSHDRASAQIDATTNDDQGHPQRARGHNRRLCQNHLGIATREKHRSQFGTE